MSNTQKYTQNAQNHTEEKFLIDLACVLQAIVENKTISEGNPQLGYKVIDQNLRYTSKSEFLKNPYIQKLRTQLKDGLYSVPIEQRKTLLQQTIDNILSQYHQRSGYKFNIRQKNNPNNTQTQNTPQNTTTQHDDDNDPNFGMYPKNNEIYKPDENDDLENLIEIASILIAETGNFHRVEEWGFIKNWFQGNRNTQQPIKKAIPVAPPKITLGQKPQQNLPQPLWVNTNQNQNKQNDLLKTGVDQEFDKKLAAGGIDPKFIGQQLANAVHYTASKMKMSVDQIKDNLKGLIKQITYDALSGPQQGEGGKYTYNTKPSWKFN